MGSSLDSMLTAYARMPIPSREEQLLLGRRIRAWLDWEPSLEEMAQGITEPPAALRRAGQRARQQLVERNMRLVAAQARSFNVRSSTAVDVEDLIQEGALGLSRAAELFDPCKGFAFSTYAVWWIRQSMNRLVHCSGSIRIPQKRAASLQRLRQWEDAFIAQQGRPPTDAEAMEAQKLTAGDLRILRQAAAVRTIASLDVLMGGDDGDSLGSLVSDPAAEAAGSEWDLVLQALSPWPDLQEVMGRMLAGESPTKISVAMGINREAALRLGDQATVLAQQRLAGDPMQQMEAGDLQIERLRALYPDGSSLFSTAP